MVRKSDEPISAEAAVEPRALTLTLTLNPNPDPNPKP